MRISLIDAAPRSASVMTVEPTEFLRLGRATFTALLRSHPAIAGKIMTRLARSLRQATEQIRTLSMFDVHGRVLRCLLVLASEQHTQWPERLVIRPRPSVKELAMMMGSTRETVSRALKVLQDTGYVTMVDRGLALEPRAIRQYFLPALQNLLTPQPSE
ncbi:MAG: Crp/Fnr family transcriptional regulator [Vicinamibacterales bacterium]